MGYTISPFFDRTTSNPFKYQIGYIEVIVQPLLDTWCEFLPHCKQDVMIKGLDENKKLIAKKIEETKLVGALNGQREDAGRDSDDLDGDDWW